MTSSNRTAYPRQDSSHHHPHPHPHPHPHHHQHANLTALQNNFTPPIAKSRKNNAATAQMTAPGPPLISSNGMYSNDASMHHMDQDRQISSSAMNLDYGMNGAHDNHELDENPRKRSNNEPQDYPRRRATIACEVCRGRKSRCDGAKPRCKLCTELKVDCIYREPGIKLDAGHKLILEHLDRLDGFLHSSLGALMKESGLNLDPFLTSNGSTMRDGMDKSTNHMGDSNGGSDTRRDSVSSISKLQTTPTLHLLEWPKIRELVSRQYDPQLLLQVEMRRDPLQVGDALSLDISNNEACIRAFFDDANVWYACVNPSTWSFTYRTADSYGFREGPESCLVLLVLALGHTSSGGNVAQTPREEEPLGMQYFSAAWGLLPSLMTSHDILASQCIILASAYLFYLVRPFEAWTLLSSTNTKLQLLLGPHGDIPAHSKELIHRVVWNAIIFESSLLYELDLPQSNLIPYEASLDLPSVYPEEDDNPPIASDDPCYLVASISLHRLQTLINQAIYSKDAPTTTTALEPIVADLDARLSRWDDSLPFPHHSPPVAHPHPADTSLRLRYHATRASIFRPFLLAVLDSSPATTLPPAIRSACTKCLDSCVRQLECVGATDHQISHSPYLWHETLSAVSQTLLVMGASMAAGLAELLPPRAEMDSIIARVVQVVEGLGGSAPSLHTAAEILREAEGRRERWWRDGDMGAGPVLRGGY